MPSTFQAQESRLRLPVVHRPSGWHSQLLHRYVRRDVACFDALSVHYGEKADSGNADILLLACLAVAVAADADADDDDDLTENMQCIHPHHRLRIILCLDRSVAPRHGRSLFATSF